MKIAIVLLVVATFLSCSVAFSQDVIDMPTLRLCTTEESALIVRDVYETNGADIAELAFTSSPDCHKYYGEVTITETYEPVIYKGLKEVKLVVVKVIDSGGSVYWSFAFTK